MKAQINYLEMAQAIKEMKPREVKKVLDDISNLMVSCSNRLHDLEKKKDWKNICLATDLLRENVL
jgi:hypothetical protein